MATIPMGEFDIARVTPQTNVSRVDNSGALAPSRAMERLGQNAQGIAEHALGVEHQRQEQERAKRDALTRVDMANASADYEIRVAAEQAQFGREVAEGKVDFRKAGEEWSQRLANLQAPPAPEGADEVMVRQFGGALNQTRQRATLKVTGLATAAEQQHYEAATLGAISKNVQIAGMPGGNTEEAVARNRAMLPGLRAAGYDEARSDEIIRKANQAIYTNEAKGRIEAAGEDTGALNGMLHELEGEGGRYVSAIDDPNQRLVLANDVRRRLQQVATAQQTAVDKREEAAKRTVADVWQQATSGVRPTTDMQTAWATTVAGTSYEAEFKAAATALQDVQGVLRGSGEEQAAYVQGLRAKLTAGGGSPEDLARIDRIESVIAASNKQRDAEPLLWLANMTGKPAEPIDVQGAMQRGDLGALGGQVQSRMDSIAAVRGTYGPSVQMHPLLPQEAKLLASAVDALPADKLTPLFGVLRQSIGSDSAYLAVMQQIAPGAPLKAYAGQLAIRPGGEKVASLVLRGDALLNAKDGKAKWPMPGDAKFTQAFIDTAGDAYQGRPQAMQQDLAAARAVYAASAAQDGAGEAAKEFDPVRFEDAMRAVVGEVADVGPSRVTVPWGVGADAFEDRAPALAADALRAAGLDPDADGIGLMATSKPGRYILVQGRTPVWNPSAELTGGRLLPVFFDWSPAPAETAHQRKLQDAALEATRRGTR